jgi:hypothetical protein
MAPLMMKILVKIRIEGKSHAITGRSMDTRRIVLLPSPAQPAISTTELHACVCEYGAESVGDDIDAVESGKTFLYFESGVPARDQEYTAHHQHWLKPSYHNTHQPGKKPASNKSSNKRHTTISYNAHQWIEALKKQSSLSSNSPSTSSQSQPHRLQGPTPCTKMQANSPRLLSEEPHYSGSRRRSM